MALTYGICSHRLLESERALTVVYTLWVTDFGTSIVTSVKQIVLRDIAKQCQNQENPEQLTLCRMCFLPFQIARVYFIVLVVSKQYSEILTTNLYVFKIHI